MEHPLRRQNCHSVRTLDRYPKIRQTVPASSPAIQEKKTLAHVPNKGINFAAAAKRSSDALARRISDCFVSYCLITLKIKRPLRPVGHAAEVNRTQKIHQGNSGVGDKLLFRNSSDMGCFCCFYLMAKLVIIGAILRFNTRH